MKNSAPVPFEHTPSTGAQQTFSFSVVAMEALFHIANIMGTIKCQGEFWRGLVFIASGVQVTPLCQREEDICVWEYIAGVVGKNDPF